MPSALIFVVHTAFFFFFVTVFNSKLAVGQPEEAAFLAEVEKSFAHIQFDLGEEE